MYSSPCPVDFFDPASGILLKVKGGGVKYFTPLCKALPFIHIFGDKAGEAFNSDSPVTSGVSDISGVSTPKRVEACLPVISHLGPPCGSPFGVLKNSLPHPLFLSAVLMLFLSH
jgi:hypothetical protein